MLPPALLSLSCANKLEPASPALSSESEWTSDFDLLPEPYSYDGKIRARIAVRKFYLHLFQLDVRSLHGNNEEEEIHI